MSVFPVKAPKAFQRAPAARAGGFSIAELMVSVVIGMLALVFVMRMVVSTEQNKQAAVGGSDAFQNGMLALFSISTDIEQAGFGINDPILNGCNTVLTDSQGYVLGPSAQNGVPTRPLTGAVIEANGAAPDVVHLYSGNSVSGTGTLRLINTYANGTHIEVDRPPYGFARNDVIVVAPEASNSGLRCALAQISNDPANVPVPPAVQFLDIAINADSRFNSGSLGVAFGAAPARLFNLGPADSLALHSWSVVNGFLRLRSTNLAGAGATPATVADNVVTLKAQYGFDTRVGAAFQPQSGLLISQWSSTMIDADGDGIVGGPGDYQRIAALRVGVVARSKAPERPAPGSATCAATTVAPVLFSTTMPFGVTAVPITPTLTVTGDTQDWKCYRYRVFESIVPLRNSGWRPT